jgi:hypothetical protein
MLGATMNMSNNKLGLPSATDHAFLAQTVTPNLQTGTLGAGFVVDE